LPRGEDAELFRRCVEDKLKICTIDKADLYIYLVHGLNTCSHQHFSGAIFDEVTGQIQGEGVNQILAKLGLPPNTYSDEPTVAGPPPSVSQRRQHPLNGTPSICVLIPVHNQAKYLYRAVTSAVWQIGPLDEIIVVDDGSTDIVEHAGLHPFLNRILWLSNPTAKGVSYSRNRGIKASQAEWIKPLDADDVLAPFALDIIRNNASGIRPNVQVITGSFHRMHNNRYWDHFFVTEESVQQIHRNLPTLPSAAFIRREALLKVGLFDERIDLEEDWDLWLRIYETYGKEGFAIVNQPICYYWIDEEERRRKSRKGTVDGVPVREYFRTRYGADPQ